MSTYEDGLAIVFELASLELDFHAGSAAQKVRVWQNA
jgi:hypothetical protein